MNINSSREKAEISTFEKQKDSDNVFKQMSSTSTTSAQGPKVNNTRKQTFQSFSSKKNDALNVDLTCYKIDSAPILKEKGRNTISGEPKQSVENELKLDFSKIQIDKKSMNGPFRISVDIDKDLGEFTVEKDDIERDIEEDDTIKAIYRKNNLIQMQNGIKMIKK